MNLELFIASRLAIGKESKGYVSGAIVKISTIGVALSLSVMLISIAVVTGFRNTISQKIIGFGGHIQIEFYDSNASFETKPISANQIFLPDLYKQDEIKKIQVFGTKAGILKTKTEFQGVVIKGVDGNYDWSFFKNNLIEGNIPHIRDSVICNQIIISKAVALMLNIHVGDDVAMYFIQNTTRMRRFTVVGIYETGMGEFDKKFIVGDIRHVQKLNDWDSAQISGFEILVSDFRNLDNTKLKVEEIVGLNFQSDGSALRVTSIKELYPQLFDWLGLIDTNVWVILTLMLLVAGFNTISSLMILILERTQMIGLLTSLGARNVSVRRIFIYQAGFLMMKGLFWGNLIGIGLCFIQYHFQIIKLDQTLYFINHVPINFNVIYILAINLGTLISSMLMMVIPSMIISKISPDTTLRYN